LWNTKLDTLQIVQAALSDKEKAFKQGLSVLKIDKKHHKSAPFEAYYNQIIKVF